MKFLKKVFCKLFTPFVGSGLHLNLLIKIPQIVAGAILAFHFGPYSFGMPWSPEHLNLGLFEVSPRFLETLSNFYDPIGQFPKAFGLFSGITKCIGGILLILGLGSRLVAFCIIFLMTIFLLNSHAINFNYTFPLFFISISGFVLYFGSGKFGIDYLITPSKEIVDWDYYDND